MISAAKKLDRVRDRAPFQPISPSLDIDELIKNCPNFHKVERVDARTISDETMGALRQIIQAHVIEGGKPLVLDNWHDRPDWPNWIFNPDWLKRNHGPDAIQVRDLVAQSDMPMTLKHYLNNLGVLTSKFTPQSFNGSQQRLYAKDIDCPPAWQQSLQKILPQCTFYLSSADLMSSLPPEARAENLMCYLGHEGTYTPAHKEMCASLGQNIMVHTSPGASSIWFMTASGDRDIVAEYWLGGLGHDIEVEAHFASIDSFKEAPFPVYIVEQKVGDYILVPPLAPHQVWNRGEATMKVAWNRTTPETLEFAIWESLPKARLVCRDEQYKNKAIIYETLKQYHQALFSEYRGHSRDEDASREKMKADFCKLYKLFDVILMDEQFSPDTASPKVRRIPNEYNVTCSFCRGNIFNRFLSCKLCIPPPEEGDDDDVYDVCLECYARGRSCGCISRLCWEEQHDWQTLLRDHEHFRQQVISIEGTVSADSPRKFSTAFKNLGRKSLAWVCQEQLLSRPFVDITKDPSLEDVDDAEDIKRKKQLGLLINCHVCKIRHPDWKVAQCNGCRKGYCYGNLWRAFDIDPFDVLSDPEWKCPYCLGICSCGQCRKNGKMHPYEPKGTMLGASTKHVADPRSVQSLVDFSRGNLTWIQSDLPIKRKLISVSTDKTDNGEGSSRSFHKSPDGVYRRPFGAYGEAEDDEDMGNSYTTGLTDIPIDPSLDNSYDDTGPGAGNSGVGGNGQYITSNDPPSVALAERGYVNRPTISTNQTDRRVSVPFPRKTGSLAEEAGIRERRDKHPLLPSPKDMLTGALPLGGRGELYDSHLSHPSSYSAEVRSVSDKAQSKALRGDIQSYPRQSFEQRINDRAQSLWPEMTSLEKDPAAFMAAAGLNMLSGMDAQYPNESPPGVAEHLIEASSIATAIPTTTLPGDGAYDDDLYQSPQRSLGAQSQTPVRNPSEIRDYERSPSTLPVPYQDPPKFTSRAKRRSTSAYGISTPTSRIIGIGGDLIMTEPTIPMRDLIVSDRMKEQKLARKNAVTSKGRGRNKKSLIVVLKLGSEGWKKWEEQKVEPDLITKELLIGAGKVHRILVEKEGSGSIASGGRSSSAAVSTNTGGSTETKKRGRGRPRKNSTPVIMDLDQDSDKDEDEDVKEEEEEEEVIPQTKSRRRESAWMARKREEEAKVDAEKAIEVEERAREKVVEDKKKAQEKAAEDERRQIAEERQRMIDEKLQKEEARLKAMEDEQRKEEERLKAIEDEKARKEEERRRAYQEAKMMAAKIAEGQVDEAWKYDSDEESDEDHYMDDREGWSSAKVVGVEETREEAQGYWWNPELPSSSFAIVIERRPGYHWKSQYKTETELAQMTNEQYNPTITASTSTKVQKITKPVVNLGGVSATAAGRGIATITQLQRKTAVEVVEATKITQYQKYTDGDYALSSDDECTASKWLQHRPPILKTKATGIDGSTSCQDDSKRRNIFNKYLDEVETFEHPGKSEEWSAAREVSDDELEGMEVEEEYDGWKHGARKWMY